MTTKFFDTNVLLSYLDLVQSEPHFYLSCETLRELEDIKTSGKKDEATKAAARRAVRWLSDHEDRYTVLTFNLNQYENLHTPDDRIIYDAAMSNSPANETIFVTGDLLASMLAKAANVGVEKPTHPDIDEYRGFKEVTLDDTEMAALYENMGENKYGLLVNQYLVVRQASDGNVVDAMCWTENGMRRITNKTMRSDMLGDKIKPKDIYQSCAIDSILNNTMTIITGRAGTGKSLLSLCAIMHLIDTGKYDRVVIMFNPTKTRGATDMGAYKGSANDKALQSNIGSMLTTKFGDRYAVDQLIHQDKLRLISMADIRGMEIRDSEILYITESQNTSVDLIKLCLSRASSGCKIIIEGDYASQVDSYLFDGDANGLKRAIDVLKGESLFGYVKLQNVWRSKIAALVDKL